MLATLLRYSYKLRNILTASIKLRCQFSYKLNDEAKKRSKLIRTCGYCGKWIVRGNSKAFTSRHVTSRHVMTYPE